MMLFECLEASAESQDEMQSAFFGHIVVREGASVFELLSGKDETLLIGRAPDTRERLSSLAWTIS